MGSIEMLDEQFPSDVQQIYLQTTHPGLVYLRFMDAMYVWPWDQAITFAVELAKLGGQAATRADAPWADIADALGIEARP